MPVSYDRDDARQLITVTVTDPFTLDQILGVIDRQAAEHTWEYAMLYDLRAATDTTTLAQVREQLVDRARLAGAGRPRGPVGIAIATLPEHLRQGLMYSRLANTVMDVEVLLGPKQIQDWFTRHGRGAAPPTLR